MKIAARRRLAVGALATSTAVIAGLLIGPALAAPNALTITPSGAVNSDPAVAVTYNSTDADFTYGGTATFTRLRSTGVSFVDEGIGSTGPAPLGDPNAGESELDLTDVDGDATDNMDKVGIDGPADAGTYAVSVDGAENPFMIPMSGGGGNDTCASCFTVLRAGAVAISSVAPNSLRPGTTGAVSVLGNNFERGSRLEVLFTSGDIDPSVVTNLPPLDGQGNPVEDGITTRTELKRRFQVQSGATPGIRNLRVTNLDGTTAQCSGCFFVAGAALTGSDPAAGNNNPSQAGLTTITFTGTNVTNGTPRLEFVGTPGAASRSQLAIPGTNVRDYSGTSITADFDLRNAAPGNNAYQPFVQGTGGVVNACDACRFTVVQDARPDTDADVAGPQPQRRYGQDARAGHQRGLRGPRDQLRQGHDAGLRPAGGPDGHGRRVRQPRAGRRHHRGGADTEVGDKDVQAVLTDGKTSPVCDACLTVTQGAAASPSPSASASASASPGTGGGDFAFTRFQGADRYATAARIAQGTFTTAPTVILANGQNDDPRTSRNESHFPDALAASYLAGNRDAPTLLATETVLPQATSDALEALATENVVIVGGPSAISNGIQDQLEDDGYEVTRIAGTNRYDTGSAIAETPPVEYVGVDQDGMRTAVLASGEGFADALVAGPLGYEAQFPVLITERGRLTPETRDTLEALDIEHVIIAGGTAGVSAATESQVRSEGITTERFAGADRYDTAALFAEYAYDELGFDPTHVDLALGTEFADALTGGGHAGARRAPILLTARDVLPVRTEEVLSERGDALEEGHIFGGTSAVSTAVENDAEDAVNDSGAQPAPSGSPSASGSASPRPSGSGVRSPRPSGSASPRPSASVSPAVSASPSASPSSSPTGGGFPSLLVAPSSAPASSRRGGRALSGTRRRSPTLIPV